MTVPATTRRVFALMLPFLLVAAAACGDDDPDVVAPSIDEPDADDDAAAPVEPSLVGLEVSAAGNVTEVLAPIAFRIDKDGIDANAVEPDFGDDDFGDLDLVEEDVLVLDVEETDVDVGTGVEVSGTIREFDLPAAEQVFDIELDDQIYGPFRDVLVIVADRVATVDGTTTTTTTAPAPGDIDVQDEAIDPAASIVGLEVTATGNVTRPVSELAFELDKDGLGDEPQVVFDDEAFDEVELADVPVLVINAAKTAGLEAGGPVRVHGTIREFDVDDAERLFGVDLDDRVYDPFDERLVIVADQVTKLPPEGEPSTTTTAADTTTSRP